MPAVLAQVLLALVAILAGARLLGNLAARLRQPRVGGEMLAGLLVGAALLSPWRHIGSPPHHAAVLSAPVIAVIDVLGQIGVILYLCLIGLKISPPDLRRNGVRLAIVCLPAVVASVALAPLAAHWFAGSRWRLVGGFTATLVMAAALMVNGLPVVARILEERGLVDGEFGATVLGASVLLTALPFLILAVAQRRIHSLNLDAAAYLLQLALTAAGGVGAAVLWPRVAARARFAVSGETALVLAVIAALAVAWLSLKLVGVGLLGGFVVGVALSSSATTRDALEGALGSIVPVILVPVFLAAAGARVDPRTIDLSVIEGAAILTALLVAVAAFAGWVCSRARLIGVPDSRAIAALLNCRGIVLLALAVQMADHRLIGPGLVAVLFLGAVATTLMTGPLLARAARLAGRAATQVGAQAPSWCSRETTKS